MEDKNAEHAKRQGRCDAGATGNAKAFKAGDGQQEAIGQPVKIGHASDVQGRA